MNRPAKWHINSSGKPWRADLALRDHKLGQPCSVAARLLDHLALSGYVVMQGPPMEGHSVSMGARQG